MKNNAILSIIDLETTGPKFGKDRILEIGLIQINQEGVINEWETLINPQTDIPPKISEITGIFEKDILDAPTFEEIAPFLYEAVKDTIIVAHNVQFDYGFLKAEFKNQGLNFFSPKICTVQLSKRLYPQFKTHNLSALVDRYGFECKNRHRAFDDANVLVQFLKKIQEEQGSQVIFDQIQSLSKRVLLPPKLESEFIEDLPQGSGVYFFYGNSEYPLYIGKSKNIRKRILTHFSASNKKQKSFQIFQQTERIDFQETSGELGALLLESRLIKEMKPVYNKQLRRTRNLASIRLIEDQGYFKVSISHDSIQPNELNQVLGIFESHQKAVDFVEKVANDFKLCLNFILNKKQKNSCFDQQLGFCLGVCQGQESADDFNQRFNSAFRASRVQSWNFPGYLLIQENQEGSEGELFIFKDWCLVAYGQFNEGYVELIPQNDLQFDRDVYRILKRHLKTSDFKILSTQEYDQLLNE